jgi:hypothetical protein
MAATRQTARKGKTAPKGASARRVADQATTALGKTVTPKTVRQWARDHIARFQDEGYTVHAYSAAEVRTILKGLGRSDARRQASKAGDQPTEQTDADDTTEGSEA